MATLSLCMIVKNEEPFLEQCLNSIKGLVDEIIIVDTGSTDKTKDIASKFTNKIIDFQWCDDFSAARNESLKHATKDWILILDADEIISEEDQKSVKRFIQRKDVSGYFLDQRNYTNNSLVFGFVSNPFAPLNQGYLGWFDSWIVRLFRNDPRITFEGEVHERVDASINKFSGSILMTSIVIHHYAEDKDKKAKEQKRQLYQKLGELKIKSEPENAAGHQQLGTLYKEEGNWVLAEAEFKKALELDPRLVTPRLDLALVQQKQGQFDVAMENYLKLLNQGSASPEIYSGIGFCYFQKQDLVQSVFHFEKAIRLNPSFLEAYINLGAIYEKQGNYDKAQKALFQAVRISPKNARAYYNLGVLHEKQLHLELALRCYQRALELNYVKEGLKERIEKIRLLLRD